MGKLMPGRSAKASVSSPMSAAGETMKASAAFGRCTRSRPRPGASRLSATMPSRAGTPRDRLAHSITPSCSLSTRSIFAAMRSLWVATRAALALVADQAEEFGEDDIGGGFVEIAGGLVGEHQSGPVGERAGDRDPLLLAARKLGRRDG